MVKIINLPYYLSHFIKKKTLFDVDLFPRTFDMESPYSMIKRRNLPTSYSMIKIQVYQRAKKKKTTSYYMTFTFLHY